MTVVLDVDGMHCGGCKKAVTNAVKAVDGAATVEVNLETGCVVVETAVPPAVLIAAIVDAGYEAKVAR